MARIVQAVQSGQSDSGAAILTVGETDSVMAEGGMIRLAVDRGMVSFDVDAARAETAGLKLSSQLLKLARKVER